MVAYRQGNMSIAGARSADTIPAAPAVAIHSRVRCLLGAGGDLVDIRQDAVGAIGLTLVDVSGHGPEAAPAASRVREVLAGLDEQDRNQHTWVHDLNTRLCEVLDGDRFSATLSARVHATTRPGTLGMTVVNAGMPTPFVYRTATGNVERVANGAPPLGVFDEDSWLPEAIRLTLDSGDVVVFVTDGVTETCRGDGERYGFDRVASLIATVARAGGAAVLSELSQAVARFRDGERVEDDVSIVVIEARSAESTAAEPVAA